MLYRRGPARTLNPPLLRNATAADTGTAPRAATATAATVSS